MQNNNTMNKKKRMDFNSIENQKIKEKFVAREVLTCFSYEMDQILKSDFGIPLFEEIENYYEYKCPECGEGFQNTDALYDKDVDAYRCTNCGKASDEYEAEPQEVYEWWIVSGFLHNKLKAKGHPVLEWGNNYYWGRCTTGQAIMLDGVISAICSEMGILEGQQYDWSK